ncbi:hypothetical protein KUM39_20130 [Streptomyces sp. J2-1]|uniref:hypothetical protein n=1 Tax=Streptomyces corallincola TaxID=2851888 RepID=UPI001C393ECA|nr:hypothetical protein [Streptomyces corallincola]MBV2356658.1 hypothetical protein [Streptomyces corallincola]
MGGSGAGAALVSSPEEKRAAARVIGAHIEPDTRTAGRWADDETRAAVRAFEDWETGVALRDAHTAWETQVRGLLNRLGAEQDALGATNTVLTGADLAVARRTRHISAFDRY